MHHLSTFSSWQNSGLAIFFVEFKDDSNLIRVLRSNTKEAQPLICPSLQCQMTFPCCSPLSSVKSFCSVKASLIIDETVIANSFPSKTTRSSSV